MIFIEGPDKVGKTTLATLLCETYKANYYHFTRPPAGHKIVTDMVVASQEQPYNTVFDRYSLSSFAYDFNDFDEGRVLTEWHEVLASIKSAEFHVQKSRRNLLIFCTASDSTLVKRLNEEGDANDYVNGGDLIRLNHLYNLMRDFIYLMPMYKPDLMVFNTDDMPAKLWMDHFGPRVSGCLIP
jgi:thymidylate kinase